MKVNVPGRGAVDISRVAVVGPAWTDFDMYRETCGLLQRTADAAEAEAGRIEFGWLPWHPTLDDGHKLRQMVHDLVAEYNDGRPCVEGVCMLPGWNADGPATFAAAVANTCGAAVMGLEEWLSALEPDDGEVELLGGGAAGCALAAENLLELLRGLPDSLARTLAVRAAEECALWIGEIEEGDE